ncbi:MAG: 3-oxoacyl-[acyl-carrier-protein] reductase [Candidatus Sumerlaeaceae bacterium]|nr:3-oxoacyl-[acyl-carrier-protein] reductase [Candidatus Sumerlaeaceae bacterium]
MKTISLEGQIAVVTGASRGIGRAIVEEFVQAGADVVIADLADIPQDLLDVVKQHGRRALPIKVDVSKVEDCNQLIDTTIAEFGKIDILVNNAGITRDALLMRMEEDAWDAVLAVNLKSVYACSRAAIKHMMKARSGVIINISSVAGIMGNAGQCNYAASKAGVIGFSKSLAREVAGRNVRVNCVAPGFIRSKMTDVLDEKVKQAVVAQIPLGRFGEVTDIAQAVLYLASPMAQYVTGAVLVVDGGMSM